MHLCFRKAMSVKEEEISKAKKSRRAISLDSGKEIMSTYWGYFFTRKVMWRLYLHGNCDNVFFVYIYIFNFYRINSFIYRLERVKILLWFNFFFGFIYLQNVIVLNFMWMWKHFGYFSWWIRWPNIFTWLSSTQGF